ncbi:phosphatase PAP2 family protein [Sinimarinibacterium sp. CAU 1509]|uniref:phosphatase PAP2 family protein n=1 Tax=Sinimarinibacterium sp. CAU 1509 TaxID=2562283 RepID=UPI00146DA9D9|nr:phosphatase PAP2 family protein [Sinimarinibacterium sp. CAU 1509]
MSHAFANLVTEFGNSALLLALTGLVAAWLLATRQTREAGLWLVVVIACTGIIAALKIYFSACPVDGWALHSPSGHAGFSAMVYGGIAHFTRHRQRPLQTWLLRGLVLFLVLAIAWSRLALHAHSGFEVLLGLGIGSAALLGFVVLSRAQPLRPLPLWLVIPGVLLLVWLWHGHAVQFEDWLAQIARSLNLRTLWCASAH